PPARAGSAFAFLTPYRVVLLGVYAAVWTTVVVADPQLPWRVAARSAASLAAQRPGATLLLGLALLLVNLAGVAAAVMPFLTLTVAYSFVAVAHLVLPPHTPRGPARWGRPPSAPGPNHSPERPPRTPRAAPTATAQCSC